MRGRDRRIVHEILVSWTDTPPIDVEAAKQTHRAKTGKEEQKGGRMSPKAGFEALGVI
jgi:hypothetical protein